MLSSEYLESESSSYTVGSEPVPMNFTHLRYSLPQNIKFSVSEYSYTAF